MAVPYHFDIVEQVAAVTSQDLTTREGAGRFTEECVLALRQRDTRWGHLRKYGAQTQYNGHAEDSVLYLSDVPGQSQSVDIVVGANGPGAHPGWGPDIPRYSASDWFLLDGPEPSPMPHNCRLGCSLFWALQGYRHYRALLDRQLAWIKNDLGADYIRIIAKMGDPRNPRDPWVHMGGKASWLAAELIGEITDYVFDNFGLKVEWTLLGDMFEVETEEQQTEFAQRFTRGLAGRWHKVEHLEAMNEYETNGGTTHVIRHIARVLKAGAPDGFPIALSSPNKVHEGAGVAAIHAEVSKMHDGNSGANMITAHWNRGNHIPPDLGPSAPRRRSSNEPRGPFSSAESEGDAPDLLGDYKAAADAGYEWYVYHCDPGIWSNKIEDSWKRHDRGQWENLSDIPGSTEIARLLKAYRLTGTVGSGNPLPDPDPDPDLPLPSGDTPSELHGGQSLLPEQFILSPGGLFKMVFQSDGNLVVYDERLPMGHPAKVKWASRTPGYPATSLQMQAEDGNLVAYGIVDGEQKDLWSTGTSGYPGAMVQLQDDGNFVVYQHGVPIWASASA